MKSSANLANSQRKSKDTDADSIFAIRRTTKDRVPSLPFSVLKQKVLGPSYILSLVFVGDARARGLNIRYRAKTYIPNVLAFPYDKNEGEIIINLKQAAREAKDFDLTPKEFVALLFVHGMLHLKGMQHGSTMEDKERRVLRSIVSE